MGIRLLYVEDNPVDAAIAGAAIARLLPSSEIDIVGSVAAAHDYLGRLPQLDIVLLDLDLPDGSGLDLLSAIRAADARIIVVILTSSDDHLDARTAFKLGADYYLLKEAGYLQRLPQFLHSLLTASQRPHHTLHRPLHIACLLSSKESCQQLCTHFEQSAPYISLLCLDTGMADVDAGNPWLCPTTGRPFDLLLIDYDDYDATRIRQWRTHSETPPIVLLTEYGNAGFVVAARELDVVEYVIKHPYYLHQLPATLENAFHRVELARRETALNQTLARLTHLLDSNPTILYSMKIDNGEPVPTWVTGNVETLLGFSPAETFEYGWWQRQLHPDDRPRLETAIPTLLQRGAFDIEYRLFHANGEVRWIHDQLRVIRNNAGEIVEIIGSWNDVTQRHLQEEQISNLARVDMLTGLANRWSLEMQLEDFMRKATPSGGGIAVALLDIDHFRTVNDSHGLAAGDELLRAIATRLNDWLGEDGIVARISGDEFAVCFPCDGDSGRTLARAFDLVETIARPYTLADGMELRLGASAGITCYPVLGTTPRLLLQQADSALNWGKSVGKGTATLYEERFSEISRQRTQLAQRLRLAIAGRELDVHYQPKVSVEGSHIVGVEALARWFDDEQGTVPPDVFIEIAEEFGLINALSDVIIERACADVAAWQRLGLPPVYLSVNISARLLQRPDFPARLLAMLQDAGLARGYLELEITESVLMEDDGSIQAVLAELKSLGFRISLDDFGTGYSSLGYLNRFPIDTLKIDKRFIRELPDNDSNLAITTAIVQLSRALGYEVLAEGVETEQQLDILRELGCDAYQGYWFSKPLSRTAMAELLEGV